MVAIWDKLADLNADVYAWTHKNLDEPHVHNQNRGFKSDVLEGQELPASYTSAFKSASLSHIATMIKYYLIQKFATCHTLKIINL
jgi:hypothetical protein